MYCYLLGLWLLLGLLPSRKTKGFIGAVWAVCIVALLLRLVEVLQGGQGEHTLRLLFMFFAGAALQVVRRPVLIGWPGFVLICCALFFAAFDTRLFVVIYLLSLPCLVLFLVYVPGGPLRLYNKCGDYSYGLYLYAFPLQQTIVFLLPDIEAWALTALATPLTLLCAMASWHWVEKPALALVRARQRRLDTLPADQRGPAAA